MFDLAYLGQAAGIAGADLLLSGDNALVIAAVCARLDPGRRRIGMALGILGAVLLRVGFAWAGGTATLWPGVGVAGAVLLLYVASNLVTEAGGEGKEHEASESLLGAVVKIVVADVSMSLDNVIAVAALARGDVGLLAMGIGFSILCVILLSGVISALIARFPIVKWIGGAFLGWVAGGVASGDRALLDLLKADEHALHLVLGGLGLAFVLVQGLAAKRGRRDGRAETVFVKAL